MVQPLYAQGQPNISSMVHCVAWNVVFLYTSAVWCCMAWNVVFCIHQQYGALHGMECSVLYTSAVWCIGNVVFYIHQQYGALHGMECSVLYTSAVWDGVTVIV